MKWTSNDLKDQSGKVFLITGANTGIGFETSLEIAKKGGQVIMAGRNREKIDHAVGKIKNLVPSARLDSGMIDLSDLSSVNDFAQRVIKDYSRLDVLINNAGVMFPPPSKTVDGYELQFGVNFMAHFALTAHLFNLLNDTPKSRVVTLSSIAHKNGILDFDNFKMEKPFDKFREYGQSKVADLIFTIEMQRRLERIESHVLSVGCHPGISKTELLRTDKPEMINEFPHMSASQGAYSSLFAATEDISGGSYFGPDGDGEMTGFPRSANIAEYAKDSVIGNRLWEYAEKELQIKFL